MKPPILSKRLQRVADMVTTSHRVCDVGCDHGFVSIYLVAKGISPRVLAMDVRKGPLSAATEHVLEAGLQDQIETRLSDGLHNYNAGEADTLICAGMGGKLMMQILSADKAKTESFCELILQPQSELQQFREFLQHNGYCIVEEDMIEEDGKFYPMMRVLTSSSGEEPKSDIPETLGFRYGVLLLQQKNEVLLRFLQREERIYGEILENLRTQGLDKDERRLRYEEVEQKKKECMEAIRMIER